MECAAELIMFLRGSIFLLELSDLSERERSRSLRAMPRVPERFNLPPDLKDVFDSFLFRPLPNPPEFLKFYLEPEAEGLLALNEPWAG